jgi:diguanylate cyclase (GGDEF)-like protein
MPEPNPVYLQASDKPSELRESMRRIDRREWLTWTYVVMVTLLLLVGLASFAFPSLLSDVDGAYSFSMNQAVRGLVGLVLIFNVYLVYQHFQMNRIRNQLSDHVFAVDKMETLAQEIYKVAILDALTGLFNRRYIEQRLEDEIARSQRYGSALAVIMFDVDGLKQMNDKHGHTAGDKLLRAFAERLKKATRGSDASARYGGDEFLVVLSECTSENVQRVLTRLEELYVELEYEKVAISYSAGWANYAVGESAGELLSRADAALYARKRAAKGQPEASNAPA